MKKKTAVISAVLFVVLGLALWFAQPDAEVMPQPLAAIEKRAVGIPPSVPFSAPAPVIDAGITAPPLPSVMRVTFHVTRGVKTAVGERITLDSGSQRHSGLVDSMGDTRFELMPGRWMLHDHDLERVFDVATDGQRFTVELPERFTLEGHVFSGNTPVEGAEISAVGCDTSSDHDGAFHCEVFGDLMKVHARRGDQINHARFVHFPADDLRIELLDTLPFRVTTSVSGASILISYRGGLINCASPCETRVLDGLIRVMAVAVVDGHKRQAIKEVLADESGSGVFLKLLPAPPFEGIVTDESGAPLRGLTVRVFAMAWSSIDVTLEEGSHRSKMSELPDVLVTDERGHFTRSTASTQPLLFWIGPNYRPISNPVVSPDDARIEIVAVPIRPAEEGVRR